MSRVRVLGEGSQEAGSFRAEPVMELLSTVGQQLEGSVGGSRFPLFWRLGFALTTDHVQGWLAGELDDLLRELHAIEFSCEAVPAAATPTFLFTDEAFPDIYTQSTPSRTGSTRERYQWLLDELRGHVGAAQARGGDLMLEREGLRIEWWD